MNRLDLRQIKRLQSGWQGAVPGMVPARSPAARKRLSARRVRSLHA
jgi:hypothetical protein